MLKNNEYFGGKVRSIGFDEPEGYATVGVMEAGEYEFGTSTPERLRIITGSLKVLLPGKTAWEEFGPGQEFSVASGVKFQLKVARDTAYYCVYR